MELQFRLLKNGFHSYICNDLGIIHVKGISSTNLFQRQSIVISDSYIIKKHTSILEYGLFRFFSILLALIFFKNNSISINERIKFLKTSVTLNYH